MISSSHLFTTSSVDPYASLGTPCLNVAADEITQLYGTYICLEKMLLHT